MALTHRVTPARRGIPAFFPLVFLPGFIFAMMFPSILEAQDAGARAAYTRGGWAGAKYVAMGRAGEVMADDVFAIYWNPAGLTGLKERENLSPEEISDRARKGSVGSISEEDLIRFSDEDGPRTVFQIGLSAAAIDIEREAAFAGAAFTAFKGVLGLGLYSIQSRGIESRDDAGNYLGDINYSGSVGYLSYAWITGVTAVGVSMKALYEKIGDIGYYGAGADVGFQVEVIPFIRVGFVVADIGTGLKPDKSYPDIENKYDFGSPVIKLSVALTTRESDFTLALSALRKLEQEEFDFNVGLGYTVMRNITVYGGLSDSFFTAGVSFRFWSLEAAYAFSYDNINSGYNNIVSLTMEL